MPAEATPSRRLECGEPKKNGTIDWEKKKKRFAIRTQFLKSTTLCTCIPNQRSASSAPPTSQTPPADRQVIRQRLTSVLRAEAFGGLSNCALWTDRWEVSRACLLTIPSYKEAFYVWGERKKCFWQHCWWLCCVEGLVQALRCLVRGRGGGGEAGREISLTLICLEERLQHFPANEKAPVPTVIGTGEAPSSTVHLIEFVNH